MSQRMKAGVFRLAIHSDTRRDLYRLEPTSVMLPWESILPLGFGKTRPNLPLGHFSFHSRRALRTGVGTGTVRSPASLFGGPILW